MTQSLWTKIRLALGALCFPIVAAGLLYVPLAGLLPTLGLIDRSEMAGWLAWLWLLALILVLDAIHVVLRYCAGDNPIPAEGTRK